MSREPEIEESLTDVAVSVVTPTDPFGIAGAVKVTDSPLAEWAGETVPHGGVPQVRVQSTPALAGSLSMVATNVADVSVGISSSVTFVVRVMPMPPATVRAVDAFTDGSATELAVTVTASVAGGREAGAVYVVSVPLGVLGGSIVPQSPVAQSMLQVTP